jgi:hypothetical protein
LKEDGMMRFRTRIWFLKWILVFAAIGAAGGTVGYWALPQNMQKLDLHKNETVMGDDGGYYSISRQPTK